MITYRLGLYQAEPKRAQELVDAIKRHPGSCDTVWLTTMGYYPSLEKHKIYAAGWVESARIFREAGLKVSLQIANTIGHCDWAQLASQLNDPFMHGMPPTADDPYLVGPDGIKNISCFCWRSEQFRQYFRSLIRIYGKVLTPYRLWFDDDLRAHKHRPAKFGCYCDRCITTFNEQNGTSYTREELVQKMNYEDTALRKKYLNFIRKGIYDFVYTVAEACLEVSPDTVFGHEYEHEHNYLGPNDEHILGALHDVSGKDVETRPGGLYYNDKSPWGQYQKLLSLSLANSILPPYVKHCVAEIENLPGVVFGKSIGGILNESTLDLASGCTGLTYTDVQSCHEPMAYYEKIFTAIANARPYWEKLSNISRCCYRSGVSIYLGDTPHLKTLDKDDQPFCWDKVLDESDINLLRIGVPLTYDKRKPAAYLLHHDAVDGLTNKEIEFLLTKPVLADGESVAKICSRGFSHHFALTPIAAHNNTEEFFSASPLKGDKQGLFYNENPYAASPMKRYTFEGLDTRTEVLGTMHNSYHLGDGAPIGPCTLVTELKSSKAKWAIFGYSIWSDLVSSAKRNQILAALDAIGPMPARLLSEEQATVIPSVNADGRTVSVTVGSASQNGTEPMRLIIRKPFGKCLSLMSAHKTAALLNYQETGEDEIEVILPSLYPYEIVTIFLE